MGGASELRGQSAKTGVWVLFWRLRQEAEDVTWDDWEETGVGNIRNIWVVSWGRLRELGPRWAQLGSTGSGHATSFSAPCLLLAGVRRSPAGATQDFSDSTQDRALAATHLHPPPSP